MARKKIREFDSKRLLKSHILRLLGLKLPLNVAQVRQDTDFVKLLEENPWLKQTKLVVKPDMLFGKRGKHDLVSSHRNANLFAIANESQKISQYQDQVPEIHAEQVLPCKRNADSSRPRLPTHTAFRVVLLKS